MVKVVELFVYVKQEERQSRCYLKMRKSFWSGNNPMN